MKTDKIKWFRNRLATMSGPEIIFRLREFLQKKNEKRIYKIPVSELINVNSANLNIDYNSFPDFEYVYHFFTFKIDLSNALDFHLDISTGKHFPKKFAKEINIRSDEFGSAKVVWEINRLEFLLPLVLSYKKTSDKKLIQLFCDIITDWNLQNPYLVGVNWYSNIEVNIRLINWYWCWIILDSDEIWHSDVKYKDFRENIWLPLIYKHCYYSYKNPSRFSSANNHLISEYAGLFIASCLWQFPESAKWRNYAMKGLEKEIQIQHSKNGINKEEAAEYIQFITDFFLIAFVVAEQHHIAFSHSYVAMLQRICDYIYNFLDIKNRFPQYGDEDDGKLLLLHINQHDNNFSSLLNTASILFNNVEWKKTEALDLKSKLLTAHRAKNSLQKAHGTTDTQKSKLYPEEGHFILRKVKDQNEIYIHFDAASLGFLSIAAHGHADALSFILHLNGIPVFIDSGTYTYHTEPEWRKYFMGTLAHNTIRINKQNQATIGGPTMWLQHYKTTVIKSESNEVQDTIIASHNGYKQTGAEHIRSFIFDKINNVITIKDIINIKGTESKLIEQPFHIHPAWIVKKVTDNELDIYSETNSNIKLIIDSKLKPTLINGQTSPEIIGWYSSSFLQKQPCTTVLSSYETTQTIIFETVIKIAQ
ncbi:hypothetical protein FC093_13990 [Ilyomonas limi]|uniref:Uncharacterized protein n=1 Tax=Ilyomonas limi TaxID=2575867 RepID=A0A4U3L1T1_9BACT|nr:alginate lyase family protein [Ilyomonas limi]TKK67407.1 hypothetical protein FC093_13990 [Ilyomonas limi]